MPLKPSYLLLTGAGAVVAYSGLKGKGISSALRDVISGKPPSMATAGTSPITPADYSSSQLFPGTGNSNIGLGVVTPPGPGETAWFTSLLIAMGAPPTTADLNSLHNWRVLECPWNAQPPDGAQYTHNPLNTTLGTSGVVGTVNSVGVKIYGSAVQGIAATAATLLGGYPAIVSALRRGVGLNTGDPAVSAELSKWSGGGYSAV